MAQEEAAIGLGDDIMATGLARGAQQRGKRIAFGDGHKIRWGPWSEEMFRHNPNIAIPGSEHAPDIEWIPHYKGNRLYNRMGQGRWIWNYDFKPVPGEFFFDASELDFADSVGDGLVLIEPNVPWHKSVAQNKDWGLANYQTIADAFLESGHDVVQFQHGRDRLRGVRVLSPSSFRHACAALSRCRLAILPEGGLHHAAAAVRLPAVVLFGGFIPPTVTGYDLHTNLTGGAEACGSMTTCLHCRRAMMKIDPEEVWQAAQQMLRVEAAA